VQRLVRLLATSSGTFSRYLRDRPAATRSRAAFETFAGSRSGARHGDRRHARDFGDPSTRRGWPRAVARHGTWDGVARCGLTWRVNSVTTCDDCATIRPPSRATNGDDTCFASHTARSFFAVPARSRGHSRVRVSARGPPSRSDRPHSPPSRWSSISRRGSAASASSVEQIPERDGQQIELDVNPYAGALGQDPQLAARRLRSYDLLAIDNNWMVEFFDGGFLAAVNDLDPSFRLDPASARTAERSTGTTSSRRSTRAAAS
jgi:hypothetical protein